MADEFFVFGLAVLFALVLRWAFKTLPEEKWQIMATIPVAKEGPNEWRGQNLTYYGLFSALAMMVAVIIMFILLGAIRVPTRISVVVSGLIIALGLPAARLLARVIEKKAHTLTICGASFVGLLVAPAAVWIVDIVLGDAMCHVPMIPVLASISIAYCLGEGLGRLACISFGCCYGKPLSQCGPWIRRIIGRHAFVFSGKTKKIAYEGGLDENEVLPIQAITAISLAAIGLGGIGLYLKGFYTLAFVLVMACSQAWRVASEFLRADYRGGGKFSSYQIMSLAAIAYVFAVVSASTMEQTPSADLTTGLCSLWDPLVILFSQGLGLTGFLLSGRSSVTASTMSFHVIADRR